jgi:cytokinin dehydrogenase
MSETSLQSDLARLTSGEISTGAAALDALSADYGGTVRRRPRVVARPTTPREVASLVRYAYERDLPITPRGGGYSFSGQALNEGGLVLDMRGLDAIDLIEPAQGWFSAQAGVEWHRVVEASLPLGAVPPVLTHYLATTLAGTLSAAGFGMSSFRHGTQIDHCLELEIVHHSGEILRCSEDENGDLFAHALGGYGEFGVITGTRQRLRPALPLTRTYYLLYDDLAAHLADQAKLVEEGRVQYIDGMLRPCYIGQRVIDGNRVPFNTYLYPMNITFEAASGDELDDDRNLAGLHFSKLVYVEDLGHADFLLLGHTMHQELSSRVAQVFNDVLVPWSAVEEFVHTVESHVFPKIIHVEHTVLWPMTRATLTRPMLRVPEEDLMMGVGLYCRVPSAYADSTMRVARSYVDLALRLGGTYYLSGSVRLDAPRYAAQFGERWATVQEAKRRHDPKGLFNPGFFAWPVA